MKVSAWFEKINIPTYEVGVEEKNPMFLEKRVYQGSSGKVYPYPVIESISDVKKDKTYYALFLENKYLKIMILPELGGRVQMAYDKIKKRHFVYYNQVIKPALVGLAGPWISGGIEFNWPQHHRPSTFRPVDYTIEEYSDGSKTVWVNETEQMTYQKGMAGFTLYPERAYLEVKVKLYNGTSFPQTFLWWANPAVAVNKHYQSVFPPDIHAVFDHGKRDVSTFPIATGTYYKFDYSKGVDISKYKNIPVPTSFMAINSEFNFVGGYENDTQAGMVHVANHHISPGKKQWTWGNGDFGRAWDRNLTDEDGPYIELMAGVYTDNQPDFAWLQPFEEKSFCQYFIPYCELGVIKNASIDFLMNLEKSEEYAIIKIQTTSVQEKVRISLDGYFSEIIDLYPENIFSKSVFVGEIPLEELNLSIYLLSGEKALSIEALKQIEKKLPESAEPASYHENIKSCEELYLTGLHLEQYRHATYNPVDYYLSALKLEPKDIRNNNALGLLLLRRGKFELAEKYFRTALSSQMLMNTNPYDGEPQYNLGLALKYQGNYKEAYKAFYKACWNGHMKDAGYFFCAQLSCLNNNYKEALVEIDQSLIKNWHNHKARALRAAILRSLGRKAEAETFIDDSLKLDTFNYGCRFEKYLISNNEEDLNSLIALMRDEVVNYEETSLAYISAGFYKEALLLLDLAINECKASPMTYYYKGWCVQLDGKDGMTFFKAAANHNPDYCFPNRIESILALKNALLVNPNDSKAWYYLGNIWYDKQQYTDAIACWEKSTELDNSFPTVMRNLSLAYFNKEQKPEKALALIEKAYQLNPDDGRVLMELDQLYKRLGISHMERLTRLENNIQIVELRDDLCLELATLYNQTSQFMKAKNLIDERKFHPWEGGEGKVSRQYQICRVELAKQFMQELNYKDAIDILNKCLTYPDNLGEGKLDGAQENDFHYFLGCAHEKLEEHDKAQFYWKLAQSGTQEPSSDIFYNDQKSDKIFYQGLACLKLGEILNAEALFDGLISYAQKWINEKIRLDYFAVSLPDLLIWDEDMALRNKVHCNYLQGLGYLGKGNKKLAEKYLNEAFKLNINHQGVQAHLNTKSILASTIRE